MTPARLAAARVLLAVERGRTTLSAEIERTRPLTADDRDRALVLELTAGTLRWRGELDAVLASCSRRPISGLNPSVRAVLRLGAYQLKHLDRIPSHAAVHESVECVRELGQPQAAGFVNAVLRSIIRRKIPSLPKRPGPGAAQADRARYIATSLSHPEWLATRWLGRYGFEATEQWCQFNNTAPEVTLRVLPSLAIDDAVAALRMADIEPSAPSRVRGAIRLSSGDWNRVPATLRPHVLIQDEASQIVALSAGAAPRERVLDVCAAPGGKTAILAHAVGETGQIIAADHRHVRVRLLAATLARAKVVAPIVQFDATRSLPFGPVFDRILIDAPCSGLGTVRRDPDVKWSREAGDLPGFAATQRAMLASAAQAVRPGGTLVYATCSSEPEENDDVVDAFLASHPDFRIVPASPGETVADGAELVDKRGFLRTLPFRDALDAYFCAVLVRRQAA